MRDTRAIRLADQKEGRMIDVTPNPIERGILQGLLSDHAEGAIATRSSVRVAGGERS